MKKLLATILALVMALGVTTLSWAAVTSEKAFPEGGGANDVVYWSVGEGENEHGFTATLAAALTAAYKANKGAITIICKPGANVGTMTHGHVADDLTIYGNGAYISDGECDLEVDTYTYSRTTGAQANDGAFLEKDITITAYDLYNLGVWGERHTEYTVNVNLNNCDGKAIEGKENVQRVYISGTTGVNNITLTGCDFLTGKTAAYSNADGAVKVTGCSFTGSAVPLNINHKAEGAMTVEVTNCSFKGCGNNDDWKSFAAPARFVQSGGNGTMTVKIDNATFTDTKGANGDILLGDGRTDKASNTVTATITNTAAEVQTQQPGYYNGNGEVAAADNKKSQTVTETEKVTAKVTATEGSINAQPAQEQPPRYYYSSTTTDTKTDTTKGSPKTFDAGIGIYAVTAVLSVTGMAWTAKKRH